MHMEYSFRDVNECLDKYDRLHGRLKVHKRTASNVLEQLNTVARAIESSFLDSSRLVCVVLPNAVEKLEEFSLLPALPSYLRQAELADVLELIRDEIEKLVLASRDPILEEDMISQSEIYEADRTADSIHLRKVFRDALRIVPLQEDLADKERQLLISALKFELASTSTSPEILHVYQQHLDQIQTSANVIESSAANCGLEDLTDKVVRISETPIARGAFSTVWLGELYGKSVSIYSSVDEYEHDKNDLQSLKESIVWSSFSNQHVVPLLGILRDFRGHGIALVSPWMSNGPIIDYIVKNPTVDRLKLIMDIISGIAYLHNLDRPYVHGIIGDTSVLVDDHGNAVVAGFASSTFDFGWTSSGPYLAPELFDLNAEDATVYSDIYSFGMVALQIMTLEEPFRDILKTHAVVQAVLSGRRPKRPSGKLAHHGLDDRLWDLINRCWAQNPRDRPLASDILQELQQIRTLPELDVPNLSNVVRLVDDDRHSVVVSGGFGDIRIGVLDGIGQVALKTLVLKGQKQPVLRLTKRFRREATIWSRLHHPNIISFLGTADLPGLSTCLVSPWMQRGNCIDYLRAHPKQDCTMIIIGIAHGLEYLHSNDPPVIHGDIRGANVLIGDAGQPLLCDFGLAVVVEDLVNLPISSALQGSGNPRWMAPELLIGEEIVTLQSDIWSFGMVMLEIFTLEIPFSDLKGYPQVILTLHAKGRPSRPGSEADCRGLTDSLWKLMEACWIQSPCDRPTASAIIRYLETSNELAGVDLKHLENNKVGGVKLIFHSDETP